MQAVKGPKMPFLSLVTLTFDLDLQTRLGEGPNTTTPQPFYGPFSGTTRVSRCQKRTSGLYGAR